MKVFLGSSVLALALAVHGFAWAQASQPSAAAIKKASNEFSLGKAAYRNEEFVEAAEHFEAANEMAPSVNALRAAMTSRHKAGQLDRAASEAALAVALYPEDEELAEEARQIVAEAEQKLFKLSVTCDEPCRLVVGTSLVHGAPATSRVVYLTAGAHAVRASWSEEDGTLTEQVNAQEGAEGAVEFERPDRETSGDAGGADELSDIRMDEPDDVEDVRADDRTGWSPAVFAVGSALTVGLGAATAISGIDALNNPGKDRVRDECTSTDCSLYRQGESKELRTNILAGATAGVGLVTMIIGLVATDWGGKQKEARSAQIGRPKSRIEPWIGVANGVTLGASGRF